MKKHLLTTTALVAGSMLAVSAQAEAEFYGQVNKAAVYADNGDDTRFEVGDNDMSSTRFGFRGEQAIGNGLTASFLIEMETTGADNTRSMDVPVVDAASAAATGLQERHARVGISGNFGSAFLGRTSSATDGITEIDLGSVSDLMGSDLNAIGGNIDDADAGYALNDVYINLEGFGNDDDDLVNLVRYDSPIYNGFQGSVAIANGGDADLAVRYGAKFGATEVKAGIGYANFNSNSIFGAENREQWSGSISAKHDSGLNGTFAYGTRDNSISGGNEAEFWYAKVGYDMGNWGFAADYGLGEERFTVGEEVEAMGVGAQYNFGNGVSAGVVYRDIEFDIPATNTDDVSLLAASLRVKF